MRRGFLPLLLLISIALIPFLQTINHDFICIDDDIYFYDNPHLKGGLTFESLKWAVTAGFFKQSPNTDYWLPITALSRILDAQFYGITPRGPHMVNLALHVGNCLLLYLLLQRLTQTVWKSFFVAAFFAIHPLQVESVAWITSRKDVLSVFFGLLTLHAYCYYQQKTFSWQRYLLVLILFLSSLMSKPMMLTLPFLMLLMDYWPLNRAKLFPFDRSSWSKLLKEKILFFSFSILCIINAFLNQPFALENSPTQFFFLGIPSAYLWYIMKVLWPMDLAYRSPEVAPLFSSGPFLVGIIILVALSYLIIFQIRRHPYLLFGWAWFLVTLSPVVAVSPYGDRFMYFPMVGLFIGLVWFVTYLNDHWHLPTGVIPMLGFLLIGAWGMITWQQTGRWKDSFTFFKHSLHVTSNNFVIHNNLGVLLTRAGQHQEAMEHYIESLRINPTYPEAHANLGLTLENQNRMEDAINHYNQALKFQPNYHVALVNLGAAYYKIGRMKEAIRFSEEALRSNPYLASAHGNLGAAFQGLGKSDDAIFHYLKSLELDPSNLPTYFNLAATLTAQRKFDEAIKYLVLAARLNPNSIEVHFRLAHALSSAGKYEEGLFELRKALHYQPTSLEALQRLAWVLATHQDAKLRNDSEAIELAKRACAYTHYQDPTALDVLAAAYAAAHQFPDAVQTAQTALKLADSNKNPPLIAAIQEHLKSYRKGQGWYKTLAF